MSKNLSEEVRAECLKVAFQAGIVYLLAIAAAIAAAWAYSQGDPVRIGVGLILSVLGFTCLVVARGLVRYIGDLQEGKVPPPSVTDKKS